MKLLEDVECGITDSCLIFDICQGQKPKKTLRKKRDDTELKNTTTQCHHPHKMKYLQKLLMACLYLQGMMAWSLAFGIAQQTPTKAIPSPSWYQVLKMTP